MKLSMMAWLKKKRSVTVYAILAACMLAATPLVFITSRYLLSDARAVSIKPFSYKHDMADVSATFEADRYWLTDTPGYSIEYAMLHQTPHGTPYYWGLLHTDIVRDNKGLFIGFVSYYMESKAVGKLLFLSVNNAFRGKRYSDMLMKRGIKELIKLGAQKVELITRPTNHRAMKVYRRLGFIEVARDDRYVYFELTPK